MIECHDRHECADVKHYIEKQVALAADAQHMLGDGEVSAAGNGQEFGESLHYALNDRVKNCHICTSIIIVVLNAAGLPFRAA